MSTGSEIEQVTGNPTPLVAGTFALYDDGEGGYVVVAETEQHGIVRKHIPGKMVKLATKFGGMF